MSEPACHVCGETRFDPVMGRVPDLRVCAGCGEDVCEACSEIDGEQDGDGYIVTAVCAWCSLADAFRRHLNRVAVFRLLCAARASRAPRQEIEDLEARFARGLPPRGGLTPEGYTDG